MHNSLSECHRFRIGTGMIYCCWWCWRCGINGRGFALLYSEDFKGTEELIFELSISLNGVQLDAITSEDGFASSDPTFVDCVVGSARPETYASRASRHTCYGLTIQ